MTLSVPPSINYQSPLTAVPTKWDRTPSEGSKLIPCEVDWGTMGGPSNCVSFNLQNNATLNFSQIVALSIDNSACGSDIEFIFPDTTETLSIPAYSPKTIVPVFTNQTQFWLSCPNAESEDITRFSILNSLPPPIAVPTTQEQSVASSGSININTGSGNSTLIASTISGTIESIQVEAQIYSSPGVGYVIWILEDGNSNIIARGNEVVNGGQLCFAPFMLSDLRVRFQNGVKFVWTATPPGSAQYNINLYYRTP